MDKIRLKGAPKQYKRGNGGPSGVARLKRRANALMVDANRLARKMQTLQDVTYADGLATALRPFIS
jgi:hypothetical protein